MVPFHTSETSTDYIQSSLKQIISQYSKEILTTFSACLTVAIVSFLAQSKRHSKKVEMVFEDAYKRKMSAKNGGGFWEYVPRSPLRIAWNELLTAQNDTI